MLQICQLGYYYSHTMKETCASIRNKLELQHRNDELHLLVYKSLIDTFKYKLWKVTMRHR